MSRHEGVSCDACLKSNFKGRRYKCLRCYDYDLCANCFENGAATSRHTPDHPVQCILSRSDYELYYGGESTSDQAHSLTCPICGRLGFTETELQTHVTSEHQNCNTEIVCPICASMPGGEPNLVTDDFVSHLTLEHRQQPRDSDEAPSARHSLRRVQQPSRTLGVGRGRRPNMHFSSGGLSPSGARDAVDPIAELLSQLSGVRRAAAVPYDRLLHHRHGASGQQSQGSQGSAGGSARRSVFPPPPTSQAVVLTEPASLQPNTLDTGATSKYQYLLDKCLDSQRRKDINPDQSLFLQDLMLAAMTQNLFNSPVNKEGQSKGKQDERKDDENKQVKK